MPANHPQQRSRHSRRPQAVQGKHARGERRCAPALSRRQQRRGNAQREFAGAAAAAAAKGGGGDAPTGDAAEAVERTSKRALREEWHRRMHARAPGGYEPAQEDDNNQVLAPELIAAGALAAAQGQAAPWYKFW